MRVFISVDMEGLTCVVSPKQVLKSGGRDYDIARKIMTREVLAVVGAAKEAGAEEIVVADSHGPMTNLLVDELPEYVRVVYGYPRHVSMVHGVEGCDVAIFLGYHAKAGTLPGVMDHTISGGTFRYVKVNGYEASEFYLNAAVAGKFGVPVALVAGDKELIEEVKRVLPDTLTLAVKDAISRYAAVSYTIKYVERELRKLTVEALEKFKRGELKPLKVSEPVTLEMSFHTSDVTYAVSALPGIEVVDARTVRYVARDIVEAYKIIELCALVNAGLKYLMEKL